MIFWITGRSGSGKTTLAKKIADQIDAVVLDGDAVRKQTGNNDFSQAGIARSLRYLANKALEHHSNGRNVIIACISPYKKMRKKQQNRLPGCIEIQLKGGFMREGTEYEE